MVILLFREFKGDLGVVETRFDPVVKTKLRLRRHSSYGQRSAQPRGYPRDPAAPFRLRVLRADVSGLRRQRRPRNSSNRDRRLRTRSASSPRFNLASFSALILRRSLFRGRAPRSESRRVPSSLSVKQSLGSTLTFCCGSARPLFGRGAPRRLLPRSDCGERPPNERPEAGRSSRRHRRPGHKTSAHGRSVAEFPRRPQLPRKARFVEPPGPDHRSAPRPPYSLRERWEVHSPPRATLSSPGIDGGLRSDRTRHRS